MEYKSYNLIEFIFKNGNLISIYGHAGSGKTSLALQLVESLYPSLYISTEGKAYQARASKMLFSSSTYFLEVNSTEELIKVIISASTMGLALLVIDTINVFYRLERNPLFLLHPLILLKQLSKFTKVALFWQMSMNNRVSGEKFMRYFSDDIIRITKNYLIGNMRRCKIEITERGVKGCLKNFS